MKMHNPFHITPSVELIQTNYIHFLPPADCVVHVHLPTRRWPASTLIIPLPIKGFIRLLQTGHSIIFTIL